MIVVEKQDEGKGQGGWLELLAEANAQAHFEQVLDWATTDWLAHRDIHPDWAPFWKAYGGHLLGADWRPVELTMIATFCAIEDKLNVAYEQEEDLQARRDAIEEELRDVDYEESIRACTGSWEGRRCRLGAELLDVDKELSEAVAQVKRLEHELGKWL